MKCISESASSQGYHLHAPRPSSALSPAEVIEDIIESLWTLGSHGAARASFRLAFLLSLG